MSAPADRPAALLSPAVRETRRDMGIATPAMIAAGEPLTEAEIAAVRQMVGAVAAFGAQLTVALGEAVRAFAAFADALPPDVRAALMAETQARP